MRLKWTTSIGKAPLPSLHQPKLCVTVSCYYKKEYSFACSQELVVWSGLEELFKTPGKENTATKAWLLE